ETKLTYENTFRSDSRIRTVDLSGGFNLEHGKTSVVFAAHYSDANQLSVQDRDYVQRGRALIMANNPSFVPAATVPPLGSTPNIRSSTGVNLTLKNGTLLNSPITFLPAGYAGSATDLATVVANAGRYNLTPS